MGDTGFSERTIRRATNELVKRGVMTVVTGKGKESTHYHLLMYAGSKKVISTFHDEYEGDSRAVSQTAQHVFYDDYAGDPESSPVSQTAQHEIQSGLIGPQKVLCSFHVVDMVDDSTVKTGADINGASTVPHPSLRETAHTGETPVPPTTTATTSGEVSPDPSPQDWHPRDKEVNDLVGTWKKYSSKPCFRRDFVNLLIRLKGSDISWCHAESAMIWMFTTSHWASESPNWKEPRDIRSTGDFVNPKNFFVLYEQSGVYLTKQRAGIEERQEREAQKNTRANPFAKSQERFQNADESDDDASFDDDDGDEEAFRAKYQAKVSVGVPADPFEDEEL